MRNLQYSPVTLRNRSSNSLDFFQDVKSRYRPDSATRPTPKANWTYLLRKIPIGLVTNMAILEVFGMLCQSLYIYRRDRAVEDKAMDDGETEKLRVVENYIHAKKGLVR